MCLTLSYLDNSPRVAQLPFTSPAIAFAVKREAEVLGGTSKEGWHSKYPRHTAEKPLISLILQSGELSTLEACTAFPRLINSINQSENKGNSHLVSSVYHTALSEHLHRDLCTLANRERRFLDGTKMGGGGKITPADHLLLFLSPPEETRLGSMGYFDGIAKRQEKLT